MSVKPLDVGGESRFLLDSPARFHTTKKHNRQLSRLRFFSSDLRKHTRNGHLGKVRGGFEPGT